MNKNFEDTFVDEFGDINIRINWLSTKRSKQPIIRHIYQEWVRSNEQWSIFILKICRLNNIQVEWDNHLNGDPTLIFNIPSKVALLLNIRYGK